MAVMHTPLHPGEIVMDALFNETGIKKEYRLSTKKVWIQKIGDALIIRPKPESWDDFFHNSLEISDDFSMERNQEISQNRKNVFV